MAIVTVNKYAKMRGWHHKTVQDKIKRGVITDAAKVMKPDGKGFLLDSEIADREEAANSDPTTKMGYDTKKKKAGKKAPLEESGGSSDNVAASVNSEGKSRKTKRSLSKNPTSTQSGSAADPQGAGAKAHKYDPTATGDSMARYQNAKATNEEMRNRKLAIDLAEAEGRLVDIEVVKKQIIKLVSETKEAILNVPTKLGPELLACTDLLELENKLHHALTESLESLSRFKT